MHSTHRLFPPQPAAAGTDPAAGLSVAGDGAAGAQTGVYPEPVDPPDDDPPDDDHPDDDHPDDDHHINVTQTLDPDVAAAAAGAARVPPPPLPGHVGRFRIDGEIAHGGMGIVLRGWDSLLGREVAVKMLHHGHLGNPGLARRFFEEARITGRLQHPGVVPILELGTCDDGQPFFAMQFVRGQTLNETLAARKNVSADLPRLLKIFEQICQAVAYAHAMGIIHRDLKPANIMTGAYGLVLVMDWGLAKALGEPDPPPAASDGESVPEGVTATPAPTPADESGTQAGTVFGTPSYLPPEQAKGEVGAVDQRSDVFGLGGILCEILTGRPPYTGTDVKAVYRKALKAKLADALKRLDACPAERAVVDLARRCLAADRAARPADAGEVAREITAYLESDQRRAERDLVRFFDVSLDLFCIAGLDGYFKRVNANFPRVLGYTHEEMLTRPFVEFVHPADVASTVACVGKLATGEPVVHFRNRYRHARGHELWLEWTARAVPEEGVIYAAARDVTEEVAVAALVRETAAVLVQRHSMTKMLQQCAELMVNYAGDSLVRVWTVDGPDGDLDLRASAGSYAHLSGPHARAAATDAEIGNIVRGRTPVIAVGDPAFVGHPLISGDRLVGVLAVSARHSFTKSTLEMLQSVANSLALGILHKQTEEECLRLQAPYDSDPFALAVAGDIPDDGDP